MNLNINHIICTQQSFKTAAIKINSKDTQSYTYKIPLSVELQEGDRVVVSLPNGALKIARVTEAHENPRIEYGSDIIYNWIVQKVDTQAFEEIQAAEKDLASKISHLQAEEVKRQYLSSLSPEMIEALTPKEAVLGKD